MTPWEIFIAPMAACLLLIGIHCYLGIHVMERGIVFVDLSLAQIAALGFAISEALGFEAHGFSGYGVAFLFCCLASVVFAATKKHQGIIPQEAIIGTMYAFSAAAIMILAEKSPQGIEHLRDSMVGQILWITWSDVYRLGIVYGFVGLVHWILRKQMIEASFGADLNLKRSFVWDFSFYVLFSIVITSSVRVSGVLLVFSFLMVPSIISKFISDQITTRLVWGWIIGAVLCGLGMLTSFKWDMAAGPITVAYFAASAIIITLFLPRKVSEKNPELR